MMGLAKLSNAPGDADLLEVQAPKAGAGNVVIEVAAAGICGTDLHIMRGEYLVVPPVVIGHELCGHVSEVGEGVSADLIGRRVLSETFYSVCRKCRYCRSGRPNLCASRKSIGTHVNGAMAPRVEVPAAGLHFVPDYLSSNVAPLTEPLACVTNAMLGQPWSIDADSSVLVVGPGPIGMLAALIAQLGGADVTIRGTQRDRDRLKLAERKGFRVEDTSSPLQPESYDVVVECSGSGAGIADALSALRKCGRLVQLGIVGKTVTLDIDRICYKELQVTSGFASNPESWRSAMQLVNSRKIDLEWLLSEATPLKDWRHAFDSASNSTGLKHVITFSH